MKQPNLLTKNPKRKFSAKQIAAQKRFAAMAKAGKFRKRTKRNPRSYSNIEKLSGKKHYTGYGGGKVWHITKSTSSYGNWVAYSQSDDARLYSFGLEKMSEQLRGLDTKKNPVKAGARRSPPKRNPVKRARPVEKFLIRGQRPVKSGYVYYYLRGREFVKNPAYAEKFSKAAGEDRMRAIVSELPAAIASITLVKA